MGLNSPSLGGKYQETVFRNLRERIHVCVLLLHCNEFGCLHLYICYIIPHCTDLYQEENTFFITFHL